MVLLHKHTLCTKTDRGSSSLCSSLRGLNSTIQLRIDSYQPAQACPWKFHNPVYAIIHLPFHQLKNTCNCFELILSSFLVFMRFLWKHSSYSGINSSNCIDRSLDRFWCQISFHVGLLMSDLDSQIQFSCLCPWELVLPLGNLILFVYKKKLDLETNPQ